MIPYDLKRDKDGLLYLQDEDILRKSTLRIDKRGEVDEYYQQNFYPISTSDDYIIKYNCTWYTRKEIKRIKEMLANLVYRQKDIPNVDFPIAYFVHMKRLSGLIVKYYKDGISFDNVAKLQDIEAIGKYYYHDEDNIHNLFMLYEELLNVSNELFENGVYYTDINQGNVVLNNNQVKLIDFDYRYVLFDRKDFILPFIITNYFRFVRESLNSLNLYSDVSDCNNYDDAKKYIKKLENTIRKG